MTIQANRDDVSPPLIHCRCGSGLTAAHCCELTALRIPDPALLASVSSEFEQARQALRAGRQDAAALLRRVLERVPCHAEALALLSGSMDRAGQASAALALAKRAVAVRPNDTRFACDLAMLYYQRKEYGDALRQARNGVRLNPNNPQAHNMMGMILTDMNRLPPGEFHYRRAIELHGPVGKLCANLALNLRNQGQLDEAETWYAKAHELEPDNIDTLLGWVGLKEAARDFEAGWKLLARIETLQPDHAGLHGARSSLLKRDKKYAEALRELGDRSPRSGEGQESAGFYFARGELLDKLGRYDEAFAAYRRANDLVLETGRRTYRGDRVDSYVNELKGFFTSRRVSSLPVRQRRESDRVTPIFIVGFPRSGTTMVEQILSGHSLISAGDELPYLWELSRVAANLLNSDLPYPRCLADLWMGENQGVLDAFHDYYLRKAEQIGLTSGGARWFTDKMPLNETHLGLIRLAFPDSPIIHMIRHPLDVILSTYFIDLTHGNNCSYRLETAAHHYVTIRRLVDHYLQELDLNYLPIRYEEIVSDPEARCREILGFVGADWEPQCLDFHMNERYARTASYAQVTEKLYDRSVARYRHYLDHLSQIIPVLQPVIEQLGYVVEPHRGAVTA